MSGMKRMDRSLREYIVRAVLSLCILTGLMTVLTGCGQGKQSDDALRWVTYSSSGPPLDAKEVINAANEVSREKIGVTVDLEFQPSEKINLMMASGEYYDMVFTSSWINPFDKNAEAGMYYDITDRDTCPVCIHRKILGLCQSEGTDHGDTRPQGYGRGRDVPA